MNLSALLAEKQFAYLTPINEHADTEREILTVESTETPDIQAYIAENALIITTAMYYAGKQHELLDLLDRLQAKKCCGLAIKVDRFLGRIDPGVIQKANDMRFPLLRIPAEKTLGEVYQDILNHIWQNTNDDLVFALNSQKVFSNLLLHSGGVRHILSTLSSLLDVEAAFIDPFGNIEYSSSAFARAFDKNEIRALVGRLDNDVHAHSAALTDRNGERRSAGVHLMRLTTAYPYYLLLLDSDSLRYPVINFIVDQAMLSLAISTSRDLNIDYQKLEQEESRFMYMIKLCARGDEQAVMDFVHAEKMTYFSSGRTCVLYIPDFGSAVPAHLQNVTYTLIYNWLRAKLAKFSDYALYPQRETNMYLIQTSDVQTQTILNVLHAQTTLLNSILDVGMRVAIGALFHTAHFQYQSYHEALNAIAHGTSPAGYPDVKVARPQDFRSLFSHINKHESDYFCMSVLGDLYDDTSKTAEDYRETLRVWLMNKSDVSKTAREMFIHRNTVSYRLERCKEILHSELVDPTELFNLAIALNLMNEGELGRQ